MYIRGISELFNRTRYDAGKFDIETNRRQLMYNVNSAVNYAWFTRVSFTGTAFTASGTVVINGVLAPAGKSVQVWAYDASGEELVATTTTDGSGFFTAKVPDNTRSYFASYDNDGNRGRSALATPA